MNNIPAGLTDNNIEVYLHNDKLSALSNGNSVNYFDLPYILRKPFITELNNDKQAIQCLQNHFNISTPNKMEHQFVSCRYGALDKTPDLSNGKLQADAPHCNRIATCQGFNIICKVPKGANGTLSRSEFMVARFVAQGLQDIEIASELNIKVPTVRTHLSRIREKLKLNNRVEVSLWMQSFGIV